MLSASQLRSNVPPYHLQAAPVLALTSIAANKLNKTPTAFGLKTQPAEFRQQHTSRLECTGDPFLIPVQKLDPTIREDPNSGAGNEPVLQTLQLETSGGKPHNARERAQCRLLRECQNDGQTSRNQEPARDQDNNA